jgi:hypothetical protein
VRHISIPHQLNHLSSSPRILQGVKALHAHAYQITDFKKVPSYLIPVGINMPTARKKGILDIGLICRAADDVIHVWSFSKQCYTLTAH